MAIDIHINNFRNLITSAPKTDYYAFNNNNNPPDLNIITAANFDDFINTSIGSAFLRYIKENRFKDPVCDKTVWEKLASSERKFSNLSNVEQQEVLDEFNRFHIQSFIQPDQYAHTCHEGGIKYIKLLIESPIGYNFLQLLKAEGDKDEILKALHSQFIASDRDIKVLSGGGQFLFVYLLREYLKSMCHKLCIPENAPDNIKAIIKQFKENKNFGSVKTLIEGCEFKIITEDNFETLINDKEFKIIFRRFQFHYGFLLWNLFYKAGKSLLCKGPVVPVLPDKDIPPDYITEYHAKIRPVQTAFNTLAENNGDIKAVPPFDRKIFLDELNKFIFEHFLFDTFITSGNIEEVYSSAYAQDFKDKFLKPQYPLLFNLVEAAGIKQLFSLYPNTANALERLFNRWFLSDRKNIDLQNQPQYVLDVLAWARGDDIADKKVLPQMIDAKYTENRKFAIITLENFDGYINDAETGDKFIYVFLKGKYLEFEKEMEKLRQNSDLSYTEAFKLRQIMPKLYKLSEIYKKLLLNKRKLDEEDKKFVLDDFNKFHFANFKYRKYFDFSDISHTAIEIGSFVFPSNPFVPPFSHNRYAQIMSVLLSPYGRDFLDNKLAKEKPYSYIYENFRACNYLIPKMEEKHKEELDILMACLIMYIQTGGESIKLNPDIENALARKYDHDCAIPDNTEGLINLVNVLEKIAFSHKETSIKPVEKVKKPKHSEKKFNIITAANFKEYLESDIGENFKAIDGILNIITGCGADISKLPEEQQVWLLAKFNDFYLENYEYETYVDSAGAEKVLQTIYGAHFKGMLADECPFLYQNLEKNGLTENNSFFITARLNTYFKSGRKTTVAASINISAEEQDKIIKENSGKISAILESGIKLKKEEVSPVYILLDFLAFGIDEYSKEKTKLIDFPLNEISELITLTLEVLNLEKFTFEAFDAKYRALAFKDDLILLAVTDTGAVAINKVTGKKIFFSDEQILARGMNKEYKGWQDTTALNALVEHWDKMLTAIAKLYSNEARMYYKVKPRLEEKYGKDSGVLKAVFKLVEDSASAVTGEQKYPQINTREKEGPEYEFKESIFKIICYNVQHENAELNKFGMLLSNSLYLKFDFLEGKKPTWFNMAQCLRKAEKLNFRNIKTKKEIEITCKNIGSILKPVGDRLIDIDGVLQTSSSADTGTSAEREVIQLILGAAKGMLVDFPLMAAHMTINPLAAKLFFWNFAHPEGLDSALTEFFNIMEKGNRFDTAAYFSFNLTLLMTMFKGGMEAFRGKTFAVEGRKTIGGIEILIDGKLCNEMASKTLLEVLKIRPEDIENKKIELGLKKRDDGVIELSNGAKLTEDGARCLSSALKSGFTLGVKRAPSEKPGEPGELRFTLNGILLSEKESREIIKAIIEARLKPESTEFESDGKRMRITGGADDLKIENLSSGSGTGATGADLPKSKPSGRLGTLSSTKSFPPGGAHKHHRDWPTHPEAGGPMPGNKRFNYPGQQPQQPGPQPNNNGGTGKGDIPGRPEPAKKSNDTSGAGTGGGVPEFTGAAKRLNDLNAKINALIAQKSRYADFQLIEILEEYNEICRELKNLDEKTNDLLSEVYKNISEAPSKLGFTKESRILFSFLNQALEKCNEAYRKLKDLDTIAKDLLADVYRNMLETSSNLDFPEGIKFLSSFLKKAPEEVLIRRISTFTNAVLEVHKHFFKKSFVEIRELREYLSLRDETCKKINELKNKAGNETSAPFLNLALNDFIENFYGAVMDIIPRLNGETQAEFLLAFLESIPDETLNTHLTALSYLVDKHVLKRIDELSAFKDMKKPTEAAELFNYITECNKRFNELKKLSALSEKKQGLIDPSRVAHEKRNLITTYYLDILNVIEIRFKDNAEVKRSAINNLPDEVLREDCVSKRVQGILTDKLTKDQEKELGILRHNLKAPFEALPATFDVFSRLLRKNKVDNPALYEKMSILHDKASALFTKVTKYFSKDSDSFTSANFRKELLEKTNNLRREVEEIGAVIKDTDFSGVPDSMKFLVESIIDSPEKIRKEIDKIESSLKLDKAYIQSNSNEFNLRSFTENIKADFVNRQAKGRPVTILVQIPENLSAYANEQALTEIFRNVLDNDIKIFDMDSTKKINETRGCVITITAKEDAASGMTEITISDNGPGVHRDRKNTILIGDSTTGGGFGLQRCVELAESHGGEFKEDGVFGIGALFVIKLPRRPKEAGKPAPAQPRAEKPSASSAAPKLRAQREAYPFLPGSNGQPQKGTDFPSSGGHQHHRDWPARPEVGGESPVNRRAGINGSSSGGKRNWADKVNTFFPAEKKWDKSLPKEKLLEEKNKRAVIEIEKKINEDFDSLAGFINANLASCGFSVLETYTVACKNILSEIDVYLKPGKSPEELQIRLSEKKGELVNTYFPAIFEKALVLLKNKKIDARNIRTLYTQLPEEIKQTVRMQSIMHEIGEELFFRENIQSWESLKTFVNILDLGIDPHKFLTNLLARAEEGKIPFEFKEKINQLRRKSIVSGSKPAPKTVIMNAVPSHPRRSAPKPKKQGAPKPKEKSSKPAPKATALSEYINNRKIKLSGPEISILKYLANNKYFEAGKALNHYSVNITEFKNNFFNLIKDEDIPPNKRLEIIGDLGFAGIEEARSKVMKFYDIQKAPKREKGGSSQKPPKTSGPLGALSSARNEFGFITNYL